MSTKGSTKTGLQPKNMIYKEIVYMENDKLCKKISKRQSDGVNKTDSRET